MALSGSVKLLDNHRPGLAPGHKKDRMMELRDEIDNARRESLKKEAQVWEEAWAHEKQMRDCQVAAQKWLSNCRRAKMRDYAKWLDGYVKSGGKITHARDYEFDRRKFVVAKSDIVLTPLYGASFCKCYCAARIEL